jgi:hypothetical protein
LKSGELEEDRCVSILETHLPDGRKYDVRYYNLDAVISVWLTCKLVTRNTISYLGDEHLEEYIIKGFVMDDDRNKNGRFFGKDYFEELLERVRSIRASERRIYRKSQIYLLNVALTTIKDPLRQLSSTQPSKINFITPSLVVLPLRSFIGKRMPVRILWV